MVVVTMTEKKRIVVGVDGSSSSAKALRWAVGQAKLTGADIEAVTVWSYPADYGLAPINDGAADFEGDAGKVLFEALAEVRGHGGDTPGYGG
jgi:nucleotide-binding universal stress UspA family protein